VAVRSTGAFLELSDTKTPKVQLEAHSSRVNMSGQAMRDLYPFASNSEFG